jgi:hypothetical protein
MFASRCTTGDARHHIAMWSRTSELFRAAMHELGWDQIADPASSAPSSRAACPTTVGQGAAG